jgi:multicomponent Na+:H+ antiporter subunit D
VSQVSYIALGTAILGPVGTIGGIVHLVHQGIMKITLFFAAGNYAETLGIHKVSEMNGVGARMPGTTLAFSIAALGMIGVPPVAGFISKWYLGLGSIEAGMAGWVIPVLIASSLLNAAYFLPVLYRAWFCQPAPAWPAEHIPAARYETAGTLFWPPVVTAGLALAAGLFAAAPYSPLEWADLIARREYGL